MSDDDTRVVDDPEAPATPLDLDYLERKARPIADWNEERDAPDQECVACKGSMHTPSELDPTALCNGCAQAYAAQTALVMPALIARIRKLEAETTHQHNVMSEHATICNKRVAGIEAIARAATAFVDEQGKRAIRDNGDEWRIAEPQDFAGEGFGRLVRAMEGAGR